MNNSQYFFGTDALLSIEDLNDIQKLLVMKINALAGRCGFCFANNKYLAEAVNKSESTISRNLSDMEKKGYIKLDFGEDGDFANRRIFMTQKLLSMAIIPFSINAESSTQNQLPPLRKNDDRALRKNAYHNNKEHNIKVLKEKDNTNVLSKSETIAKIALEYLSEKTGKEVSFSKNGKIVKGNTQHLFARIKEGYGLEDFKRVIDTKVLDWLKDAKMSQYLRPQTLFNSEKFVSYLEQPRREMTTKDLDVDFTPVEGVVF